MSAPTIWVDGSVDIVQISNGDTILTIPVRIHRRSGKRRLRPAKAESVERPSELTTMQMSLLKGYRWLQLLDSGEVASMKEIAERENVDFSYVSRMINMTMLSPDIIEAILDDTIPDLTVEEIAIAPPDLWDEQHRKFKLHKTHQGLVRHR